MSLLKARAYGMVLESMPTGLDSLWSVLLHSQALTSICWVSSLRPRSLYQRSPISVAKP